MNSKQPEKVFKVTVSPSKTSFYLLLSATSPAHHNKMASSLLVLVVFCLISGLWTGANAACGCSVCPPGWTLNKDKCYMFHHKEKNWVDAERFCVGLRANLASLRTKDEYEFIRYTIERMTGSAVKTWVGGLDTVKENVWMWTDGSPFDFKDWPKGEPNGGTKENCMEINYDGKDYVNDINCDVERSFICARPL